MKINSKKNKEIIKTELISIITKRIKTPNNIKPSDKKISIGCTIPLANWLDLFTIFLINNEVLEFIK